MDELANIVNDILGVADQRDGVAFSAAKNGRSLTRRTKYFHMTWLTEFKFNSDVYNNFMGHILRLDKRYASDRSLFSLNRKLYLATQTLFNIPKV